MELWIRSQDKENLIQPTRLFIAFDKNIATWDGNIMIDLGNYETKERALEVLDEIQKTIETHILGQVTTEWDAWYKSTVYEMPKE